MGIEYDYAWTSGVNTVDLKYSYHIRQVSNEPYCVNGDMFPYETPACRFHDTNDGEVKTQVHGAEFFLFAQALLSYTIAGYAAQAEVPTREDSYSGDTTATVYLQSVNTEVAV